MDEVALDDLSYLVRAEVRARLLDRLVAEGAVERDRFRDGAVAWETLGRTLAAFETRGWATATSWRATSLGAHVARAVRTCLDEGAANEVAEAVALLPPGARSLEREPYLDAESVRAPQRTRLTRGRAALGDRRGRTTSRPDRRSRVRRAGQPRTRSPAA